MKNQRPLGVPTVLDRVIQQAIAQVLTPLYDGDFSQHSYGFRAGRNAHQAVRQVEARWKRKRCHAVDGDLKAFFAWQPTAGRRPADRLPRRASDSEAHPHAGWCGGVTGAIPSCRPD
jgi:hypothetical protein